VYSRPARRDPRRDSISFALHNRLISHAFR